MQPQIRTAYLFAVMTSIAYAVWYLGSGVLLKIGGPSVSPLFVLFAVETISAALIFIAALGNIKVGRISDIKYALLSALFLVVANYIFYITIIRSGVPPASSFASAELVVFTALLWFTSKSYKTGSTYALGAFIITVGLIAESFVIQGGGAYALNFTTIGLGITIAFFNGIGTYFYYLSIKTLANKYTTMFYIQGIEAVSFFILLNLARGHYPAITISLIYWPLLAGVGIMLFLSFYFQTYMMKILVNFKSGIVATGYILSDLELLPVLFYFLIVNPGSWLLYAPGIVLVTIGMVLLEWR